MTERRKVTVGLGARAYDILIGPGLVIEAGRLIAERWPGVRVAVPVLEGEDLQDRVGQMFATRSVTADWPPASRRSPEIWRSM